jgi:2-dehydro-3-deoxygalactonokinase
VSETALIGLDWGTSSLRAFRIAADGSVLERREGAHGILAVHDGDFEGLLWDFAGDWLDAAAAVPLLASGMITSRQGWVETPYLPCPAGAAALARTLVRHRLKTGRLLHFVPGLMVQSPGDAPDLMRGEETQIVGAAEVADGGGLFVLPGTHSKWAFTAGGQVLRFATFLTGELYALLRQHSILGRTMTGEGFHATAFDAGVRAGFADLGATAGLLHRLFGVRSRALMGELPADAAPSFLSGLLIGWELREAFALFGPPPDLGLIGNRQLVARYQRALTLLGVATQIYPEEIVARGHMRIARAAGLVT